MIDHISIPVADLERAAAFYDTVLATVGIVRRKASPGDAGAPGVRPEYTQPFYGAFVFDLDGFKVEAVCRVA